MYHMCMCTRPLIFHVVFVKGPKCSQGKLGSRCLAVEGLVGNSRKDNTNLYLSVLSYVGPIMCVLFWRSTNKQMAAVSAGWCDKCRVPFSLA